MFQSFQTFKTGSYHEAHEACPEQSRRGHEVGKIRNPQSEISPLSLR
jgi:hypothetical protein